MKKGFFLLPFAGVMLFSFMLCAPVSSDIGVGISGNGQTIVIDSFPHHYSNTFWIQNTGDEPGIFSVAIVADYPDVVQWVSLEPAMAYLEPDEGASVTYNIHAKEGYGGKYVIHILAVGYGTGPQTLDPQPVAYMKAQTQLSVEVEVTEEAGSMSWGSVRPIECDGSRSDEKMIAAPAAVVVDAPLYIDVPSKAICGDTVHIASGFIDNRPVPQTMGFMVRSPSGDVMQLPIEADICLDEAGEWIVAVELDSAIVLGREIEVAIPTSSSRMYQFLFVGVASIVGVAALLKRK